MNTRIHVRFDTILLCLIVSRILTLKLWIPEGVPQPTNYWQELHPTMIRFLNARLCFIHSLLLCSAIPVYSQTLISLPGKRIAIKDPKFYISEIIDARSNKEMVGIVQRGLKNRQETASFENGFQDELKNSLEDFLQSQADRTPLIVRILKLNVYERTLLNSETAVAEVIAEFYTK